MKRRSAVSRNDMTIAATARASTATRPFRAAMSPLGINATLLPDNQINLLAVQSITLHLLELMKTLSLLPSLTVLAIASLLAGCASTPDPQALARIAAADPATLARVRIYGNNGAGIVFYRSTSCIPKSNDGSTRVSGGAGQSFGALVGSDQNVTIGMPPSDRSTHSRNGILAREYFKEYQVTGGEPLTVTMGFTGTPISSVFGALRVTGQPESCRIPGGAFVPKAGQDYDVYLDLRRNEGMCLMSVSAIGAKGEPIEQPVQVAKACP